MTKLVRTTIAWGFMAAVAAAPALGQSSPTNNQATADAVARSLSASPSLKAYRIGVESRDGLVVLRGAVATPAEHSEAIQRARSTPGVTAVQDFVKVGNDPAVQRTRYNGLGHLGHGGAVEGAIEGGPAPEGPAVMPGATAGGVTTSGNLPNYAWPSYAPHPNFSAVGYPTVYPWQAWPNIGPFYPYPEVPLDWRAVTLRWDDGLWWLDFKKHYTRPFITPYPFGIFGY